MTIFRWVDTRRVIQATMNSMRDENGNIGLIGHLEWLDESDAAREDEAVGLLNKLTPEFLAKNPPYYNSDHCNDACVAGAEFVVSVIKQHKNEKL